MEWQTFEDKVRTISSFIWDMPGQAKNIAGMQVDCVIEFRPNYVICIEASTERSLSKLRNDLAKFANLRLSLAQENKFADCYFVCEQPSNSLIMTGNQEKVTVLSLSDLKRRFFDYPSYHHRRSHLAFGSAVDPVSGEKDKKLYIPVKYTDVKSGTRYSIEDFATLLLNGKRIVLLGSYGTGKSRCMQELFASLRKSSYDTPYYPLGIDLRQNWGTKRAHEIIRRHFDDIGISTMADNVIKVLDRGPVVLLLDGFDEMASQSWSDNPGRLRDIRKKSLQGVRDLIQRNRGGIIITGRDNYFNSNYEMFECLGLNPNTTIVASCAEEFSDSEIRRYLGLAPNKFSLPRWLPRRPLICSIINQIDPDTLELLLNEDQGEASFWEHFTTAICNRESRIDESLSASSIRSILRRLARLTRNKPSDVQPISILEINAAFNSVIGYPPSDEAALILQRLPPLGRIASDNPDRRFVDYYLLDGLRAEDLIRTVRSGDLTVKSEIWLNPLRRLGISLIAEDILTPGNSQKYVKFMKQIVNFPNRVLLGDILAGLLYSVEDGLDFDGMMVADSHISFLDLSRCQVSNLTIRDSIIEELDITQANVTNVFITGCVIQRLYGIFRQTGTPNWLRENHIENYEVINSKSGMKRIKLSLTQRMFLSITRKLFFQPGSGKKENHIFRPLDSSEKRVATKIINLMLKDDIIGQFKGDDGIVYTPNRKHSKRIEQISLDLTNSKDHLWMELNNL